MIERWGTGIQRIIDSCQKQNLPIPIFEEYQGFRVIFRKPYAKEELRKLGLNERQIKAVEYVEKKGSITNREYRELTKVAKCTATKDLRELVKNGVFKVVGKSKREIKYVLVFGSFGAKKVPRKVPNEKLVLTEDKKEVKPTYLLRHHDSKMTQKLAQKLEINSFDFSNPRLQISAHNESIMSQKGDGKL